MAQRRNGTRRRKNSFHWKIIDETQNPKERKINENVFPTQHEASERMKINERKAIPEKRHQHWEDFHFFHAVDLWADEWRRFREGLGRKENFVILLLHSTFDTHSRFTLRRMPSSPELFSFTFLSSHVCLLFENLLQQIFIHKMWGMTEGKGRELRMKCAHHVRAYKLQ